MDELLWLIQSGGTLLVPVVYEDSSHEKYEMGVVSDDDGREYMPCYTTEEEAASSSAAVFLDIAVNSVLLNALFDHDIEGVVIDPFGRSFEIGRTNLWGLYYMLPAEKRDRSFINHIIGKALIFAIDMHAAQTRKGTDELYITHPVEVMSIMNSMGITERDPELVIAGLLHDTIEDTPADPAMIERLFGGDVRALILSNTEDKRLSWDERKQNRILSLTGAGLREKILVLSDMLANERSMCRGLKKSGEALWDRFNAPREKIAWYYGSVIDELAELKELEETREAYRELSARYDEIFFKLKRVEH